jgi:hypothetical protein
VRRLKMSLPSDAPLWATPARGGSVRLSVRAATGPGVSYGVRPGRPRPGCYSRERGWDTVSQCVCVCVCVC